MYLLLSIFLSVILGFILLHMGPLIGGVIAFGILFGCLFRGLYLLIDIHEKMFNSPKDDKGQVKFRWSKKNQCFSDEVIKTIVVG